MRIEFVVGTSEPHEICFRWGQFWGTSSLHVDGVLKFKGRPQFFDDLRTLSNPGGYVAEIARTGDIPWNPMHMWALEVGQAERHAVHIVKMRPKYFAGFRPSTFVVVVDGEAVLVKTGF